MKRFTWAAIKGELLKKLCSHRSRKGCKALFVLKARDRIDAIICGEEFSFVT